MAERQQSTESVHKDEAGGETAMERFRSLARKLLNVSRDDLDAQRRTHDEAIEARRSSYRKPP